MCQWQHFLDKLSYVGVESSCCDLQVTLSNDTALPRSHVKFNLLMKVLQKNQPTGVGLGNVLRCSRQGATDKLMADPCFLCVLALSLKGTRQALHFDGVDFV